MSERSGVDTGEHGGSAVWRGAAVALTGTRRDGGPA